MKQLSIALAWTLLPLSIGIAYALAISATAGIIGLLAGCVLAAMFERGIA